MGCWGRASVRCASCRSVEGSPRPIELLSRRVLVVNTAPITAGCRKVKGAEWMYGVYWISGFGTIDNTNNGACDAWSGLHWAL